MELISQQNFSHHLKPFYRLLQRKSLNLTRDPFSADDLMQETIYRAYKSLHTYKHNSNFKAWLFRILLNTYISDYRKKFTHLKTYTIEDAEEFFINENIDMKLQYIDGVEESALIDEFSFSDDFLDAFNNLKDCYREVVIYSDVYDFSYQEIAEKLKIPIGTVMSRIYRARKDLRIQLYDIAKSHGYIDQK